MSTSSEANESKTIVIDLDASRYARVFEVGNSLRSDLLNDAKELIDRLADDSRRDRDSPARQAGARNEGYAHQMIGIHGPRGSGKTSFILSLEQLFRPGPERKTGPRVYFLSLFEPAQLEIHEVPLISIAAQIREQLQSDKSIDDYLKRNERNSGKLEKAYNELASNMPALHSDAYKRALSESVTAPELAGQLLTEKARSARNLAASFRNFIRTCLEVMREVPGYSSVEALVLPIDDTDMHFKCGWNTMETLRRYCSFPQLIIVASGDPDLLHLVARLHYENETKPINSGWLMASGERDENWNLLRTTIDQYLLKLFPRENRLKLQPSNEMIDQLLRDGKDLIVLKSQQKKDGEEESLRDLIKAFQKHILQKPKDRSSDSTTLGTELSAVFGPSLRTITDVLDQVLWPLREPNIDNVYVSILELLEIFKVESRMRRLRLDHILKHRKQALHAFTLAITASSNGEGGRGGRIDNLYNLTASYTEQEHNRVAVCALAAVNYRHRKYPEQIPYFWLVVVEPYLNWEVQNDERKEEYIKFLHISSGEQPADIAGRHLAWSNESITSNNRNPRAAGVVKLQANSDPEYRYAIVYSSKKDVSTTLGAMEGWREVVRYSSSRPYHFFPLWTDLKKSAPVAHSIAAPFIIQIAEKRGQAYYCNFQRGMGALADILLLASELRTSEETILISNEENIEFEILKEKIRATLKGWSHARVYVPPERPGRKEVEEESDPEPEESTGGTRYQKPEDQLVFKLAHWLIWVASQHSVDAPPMSGDALAGAWRRFHYNLIAQTDAKSYPQRSCTLGMFLRRCTLAFLNAIVVEELLHPHPDLEATNTYWAAEIDNSNIGDSIDILSHNIGCIKKSSVRSKVLRYSLTWLRCPWLLAFLSESDLRVLDYILGEDYSSDSSKEGVSKSDKAYIKLHAELMQGYQEDSKISWNSMSCHGILCGISPWMSSVKKVIAEEEERLNLKEQPLGEVRNRVAQAEAWFERKR